MTVNLKSYINKSLKSKLQIYFQTNNTIEEQKPIFIQNVSTNQAK